MRPTPNRFDMRARAIALRTAHAREKTPHSKSEQASANLIAFVITETRDRLPAGHLLQLFRIPRSLHRDLRGGSCRCHEDRRTSVRLTTAPMFSSRRCSLVVPGIGTIHGFCASTHASAIWAGVAFFRCAILPSRSIKRLIRLQGLRRKARKRAAEIGAVEFRVLDRSSR